MNVLLTKPMFEWNGLEDSPTIQTIRKILDSIPDGRLLESLRRHRGLGRNDYLIPRLWGTVLLRGILRHERMESCLAELRRNRDLRRVIGIETEDQVPHDYNISRFMLVLGSEPHFTIVREMFGEMVVGLGKEVEDLGEQATGDATHLNGRAGRSEESKGSGLPAPAGGRKEYLDEEGKVSWVLEWFGYKLHLLMDARHEVALAWRVSSTKADETEEVKELVKEAKGRLPEGRVKSLSYDRAGDDGDLHRFLNEEGICPVIRNRRMWKEEKERLLPGHDGTSNIVYDESGTIWCYDKVSDPPIRREMAYIGYEKSRGTLKYRCPARHWGFACKSECRCNGGKKYGKTLRVPCELDFRRFPAIPRRTKQFERLYKGRSGSERVIGRLKLLWGVDDGNVWGAERFHAQVAVVMLVHLGFAQVLAEKARGKGVLSKTRVEEVVKHKPSVRKGR